MVSSYGWLEVEVEIPTSNLYFRFEDAHFNYEAVFLSFALAQDFKLLR